MFSKNFLYALIVAVIAMIAVAPVTASESLDKKPIDPRIILQYDFKSDGSCEVYGQLVDLETMKSMPNQIINYKYYTENYDLETMTGIYVQSKLTTDKYGKFKVVIPERCFTKYNEPIIFRAEYNSAENGDAEGKDTKAKIKIPNNLEGFRGDALEGGFRG